MATALDICTKALQIIGVQAVGEPVNADEAQDTLASLNTMIDSWSTERLSIYVITSNSFTLAASQLSYTLGPTGDLVMPRPMMIQDDSFIRVNGADFPLVLLAPAQYRGIIDKSPGATDLPIFAFYDTTFPLGTLYFWPPPIVGTELFLYSQQVLTGLATLATTFSFPPGYQRAFEYSLAEEIAPSYGVTPLPLVTRIAASARRNIKRMNLPDLRMNLPAVTAPMRLGYYDYTVL